MLWNGNYNNRKIFSYFVTWNPIEFLKDILELVV